MGGRKECSCTYIMGEKDVGACSAENNARVLGAPTDDDCVGHSITQALLEWGCPDENGSHQVAEEAVNDAQQITNDCF